MSNLELKSEESAAKKGIFAGALLAAIEVAGGLVSGSLGLVSSASNTLMDFVAAVITFFAVKEGSKPPDEVHMYGHEKVESAAAMGEILLLVVVCFWISYNAFLRLSSGESYIGLFWVALGTNFVSIPIDLFAYVSLKSHSKVRVREAMEAGALHFLNDLLIAVVVIFGLVLYRFGLWYADSIAALGIVVFILYSSMNMVRNSISVLVDAAPRGVMEQLRRQILSVENVEGCHHIRVRQAGSRFFVDAHVEIAGHLPLNQAHWVASRIEDQIAKAFPNSDVLIHTEPHTHGDPLTVVRTVGSQIPEIKGVHNVIVKTVGRELSISYHIELDPRISVEDAHDIANSMEERVRAALKNVSAIISHLEPATELLEPAVYSREELDRIRNQIVQIARAFPSVRSTHETQILTKAGKYSVTLHCTVDGSTSLVEAHRIATQMEEKIKTIDPRIEQVTIHCEPEDGKTPGATSSEPSMTREATG